MEKGEFVSKLNTGTYDLAFTKLDGSLRNMIATRNLSSIPATHHPLGKTAIDNPLGPVAVFDLAACGWRSVYPSSVISMEVTSNS